ncbi:MAG: hypothetical protein U9P70_03355 [Patescibacteria group bacterium]|nr:hypothetical protein [Patescibacteria group bacterium]
MYKGGILNPKTEGLSELPVAVIKQKNLDLMFGFVLSHCPYEINGRGYVRLDGNIFNIEDVFILPQKSGLGFVDENEGAIHRYIAQNLDKNLDLMNFQWHSHPGEVYFSSKDQESARRWGETMDFVLSLVVNEKFEYVCRLDIFKPVELSMQIPLVVTHEINGKTMQFCKSEIAKKVTMSRIGNVRSVAPRKHIKTVALSLDDVAIER